MTDMTQTAMFTIHGSIAYAAGHTEQSLQQ